MFEAEADYQPYVTDLDFKYASLPPEITLFLSEVMPSAEPVDGHADGSANACDCKSYVSCEAGLTWIVNAYLETTFGRS